MNKERCRICLDLLLGQARGQGLGELLGLLGIRDGKGVKELQAEDNRNIIMSEHPIIQQK